MTQERPSGIALQFSAGRYRGGEYPMTVGREVSLGRDPASDLHVDEDGVSRQHARLSVRDDGMVDLKDLHSTNGTFVNGQRVQHVVLREGDKILVGHSIISVIRDPLVDR